MLIDGERFQQDLHALAASRTCVHGHATADPIFCRACRMLSWPLTKASCMGRSCSLH